MGETTLLNARRALENAGTRIDYYSLEAVTNAGLGDVSALPASIKVLLESALRNLDGSVIREEDVARIAAWDPADQEPSEIPFIPGRVVLQDFTGVPAVVDLAALRNASARLDGDPGRINPLVPCDLVIDHSVQVDYFGRPDALRLNAQLELGRNRERYELLKWGQQAFESLSVVPPATGIVHQVNLEHLAKVVLQRDGVAYPDSLVGTDSHTTMINGLGVVGWGVGGIEAEAVMLGQPIYMLAPRVVGLRLDGELPEGATATDLVLTVTEILREAGVVGQFVELYGPGLDSLSLPDRATISNMAPEYGATMGFFPVDEVTLEYLRLTGRGEELVGLVERYCKEQGLWRQRDTEPVFSRSFSLDLAAIEPCLAGPKRPQDRVPLVSMHARWREDLASTFGVDEAQRQPVRVSVDDTSFELADGAVVIAAITSCTNTSNPSVMLGAGLLAKKAVERGLEVPPWVKTSLAPGSRVVTDYLEQADLVAPLERLGFHTVGYGCTTCIGNSGPLPEPISRAVRDNDLVVASVLSGNRNFEGRINPDTRANYLASPPLVVAYALAGTVSIDLRSQPIGTDSSGKPVLLEEIWPSAAEIREAVAASVSAEQFRSKYADVLTGPEEWQAIEISGGSTYDWSEESTYIRHPPFFAQMSTGLRPFEPIRGARVLAFLGRSVTTDHISPAGTIPKSSPAGRYLIENGAQPRDFNSYGSRRGNHEVMMRGTFANIRLRNLLVPDVEGGVTVHHPSGEQMSIYDAAMRYAEDRTPLIVLAGAEYGTGSSRDWAAKGTALLGVRAVIAASFERIHRSNLVGMGVLPLQLDNGSSFEDLGIDGTEVIDLLLPEELEPGQALEVVARSASGDEKRFSVRSRLDTPIEVEYLMNGGILHTVLRRLVAESD